MIERLYVLDRGVTQLLIERAIDAALISYKSDQRPESVTSMTVDQKAVVDGIFRFVKGDRQLSTSYKEFQADVLTYAAGRLPQALSAPAVRPETNRFCINK